MKKKEKLEVNFDSRMSESDGCICDACHNVSRVIEVTLPTTKFFDGEKLSTKYEQYWLCEKCHQKLLNVLLDPAEVES